MLNTPGFYQRCNMVDRFEQRIHFTCQAGIEYTPRRFFPWKCCSLCGETDRSVWALQFEYEDSPHKFAALNNVTCEMCRNCLQPAFDQTFAEHSTGEFWSKRYETIHHLWTVSNTCLGLLRGATGWEMKGWLRQTVNILRGIIEWLIGVDCSVNLSGCFD